MKAAMIGPGSGLPRLKIADLPAPEAPGAGEIFVRIHANSLNYHDYRVVNSDSSARTGLIPKNRRLTWARSASSFDRTPHL